jgi:hypothetical protein
MIALPIRSEGQPDKGSGDQPSETIFIREPDTIDTWFRIGAIGKR